MKFGRIVICWRIFRQICSYCFCHLFFFSIISLPLTLKWLIELEPPLWWVHTIAEVCNFSLKCINTRRLPLGQKRRYRLKKNTARMLKTTTPCNRWKIFLLVLDPHIITFSLVWQHHEKKNMNTIKKIENRAEKLHTSATFWSHLC